jgi:hypothetical protein
MTLTLWRGDHLLGELRTRAPSPDEPPRRSDKPPSLSAILVPAPGPPLSGVWQVHFPIPGFAAVHQYPVEPDILKTTTPCESRPGRAPAYVARRGEGRSS